MGTLVKGRNRKAAADGSGNSGKGKRKARLRQKLGQQVTAEGDQQGGGKT